MMARAFLDASDDDTILRCHRVMHQLRPHRAAEDFVLRVRLQQAGGYRLLALLSDDEVRCVAGYRILENLVRGRVLYVDDLVTDAEARSEGHGDAMFDRLLEIAVEADCDALELDSGVQRHDAHRFYFRKRMAITSYRFGLSTSVARSRNGT